MNCNSLYLVFFLSQIPFLFSVTCDVRSVNPIAHTNFTRPEKTLFSNNKCNNLKCLPWLRGWCTCCSSKQSELISQNLLSHTQTFMTPMDPVSSPGLYGGIYTHIHTHTRARTHTYTHIILYCCLFLTILTTFENNTQMKELGLSSSNQQQQQKVYIIL